MSSPDVPEIGSICWRDLTVADAGRIRVTGPRSMGEGRLCVIRDPAGAVCALDRPPRPGR